MDFSDTPFLACVGVFRLNFQRLFVTTWYPTFNPCAKAD
nr:MAG TPA: hypothetical protein [Caudoviricetes sp.]